MVPKKFFASHQMCVVTISSRTAKWGELRIRGTVDMKADRGDENPWYSWRIQISNFPRKPTFYEHHRSNSPCCWVVFPQVKSALTASKYLRDPNFARRWRSPCVSMFCNEQRFPCWMYALLYVSVRVCKVCLCLWALCAITLSLSSLFSPDVKILQSSPVLEC